ncbi:MAG TPA: hypothetical protein VFZ24_16325 [Longimicrobiales bacterium]
MRDTRVLTAAAMLVLSISCAPTSPPGLSGTVPPRGVAGDVVRVDEAAPSILAFPSARADELWLALPVAFERLGIPANVMDRGARIYGNPKVTSSTIAGRPARSLFRCSEGGAGVASMAQYRIEFGIAVQPRPVADRGAELIVQTQALGRIVEASRSGTIHCVSNGELESRMKEEIEAELERIRT